MATVAEWYRITYIDTHLQRFNDAQRLVQADIQQQFLVAQLLNEQIKNLDKQIQDINDAQSKGQFDRLVKAYGLEQQVISDTQRRQLSVISTVDDMYRIDSSLASIGTAADSFGNALSTAGSIEGKVGRFARTVGGYTRGSEQAKAVAATIYDQFKAAANARGASFAAQFNTNDAKIRKEIAQATGVTPTDISTVNQQKEAKLNEMLQDQGQQAISNKEIQELIALAKTDDSTPQQIQDLEDKLLASRTALSNKQLAALQRASITPEEKMMRAREIYNTQFAPKSVQNKARGAAAFSAYFETLDPVQQNIMLGFNETTPQQAKFMQQPRYKIEGNAEKETAYDLYYDARRKRLQGQPMDGTLHQIVADKFPGDVEAQQRVLGYIFRASSEEAQISAKTEQDRLEKFDKQKEKLYGPKPPPLLDRIVDFVSRIELGGGEADPIQPVIYDEDKDEAPPVEEDPESGNKPGDTEEQPAEEIPPQPEQPPALPPAGTVYRFDYVDKGVDKEYGYEITGYDAAGNPIMGFRGLNAKKGDPLGKLSTKKLSAKQQKEAMERYNQEIQKAQE